MSSNMVVMTFSNEYTADQVRDRLVELQKAHLIKVDDAVVVVRGQDGKVKVKQAANLAGAGALSGAFWGMLIGLLFFVPFFGLAVGAAMGALMGHFANYGIDQNFIDQVRAKVTPGTSALFLLSSGAVTDKVADAVKGQQFEIIQTNLSKEQEDKLRADFGE